MTATIYTPVAPMIKNAVAGYAFTISLLSQADTKLFLDNPALQAADFGLIGNGVYIGTLTNLPVAVASATRCVRITLTQAETNYNEVTILVHDNAGALFCDLTIVKESVAAVAVGTSDVNASIFTGITSLAEWLRGMFRKDAMNAAAKLEINTGGGTYDETTDSLEANRDNTPVEIDATLTAAHGAGAWGSCAGSGSVTTIYTVTDALSGLPIADVSVWATTDIAGANIVASGSTDTFGNVTFYLDPGIYYIWRSKAGYYINVGEDPSPETITVV